MYVCVSGKGDALFKFPYSAQYDIVQKMRGIISLGTPCNNPVDFMEAGLVRRDKWDMWHTDVPLAISNDETPAFTINNGHVGANHGQTAAATLMIEGHDKTMADVGSFWRDSEGTGWTLLHVEREYITLISENIGESYDRYAFKKRPVGVLSYVENGAHPKEMSCDVPIFEKIWLEPVDRYIKRELYVGKEGALSPYSQSGEYDYAEIHEEYDLMHPVAMTEAIRRGRPEGGYTFSHYKAVGKPMMRIRGIYRITKDGTFTHEFSHRKLCDVHFEANKGVIYQEKVNAFRGGIDRYIPKLLPLSLPEGDFDFSKPVDTLGGPFPEWYKVQKSDWENPDSPPDRMVDYYKDENGEICMGFACGYLPVLDGRPEIRKEMLECAAHLVRTRKGYPFFMSGDITACHGLGYRKYFPATSEGSLYAIPFSGKTYIYMDFFKKTTLSYALDGDIHLLEKSDAITFEVKDGTLYVEGKKGYAVFLME